MNVTYGITIAPKNDRYITIAEKALAGMAEAANPGAFLVDLLPFRKYLVIPYLKAYPYSRFPHILCSKICPVSTVYFSVSSTFLIDG
jgi:hypothetical protein